MSSFTQSSNSSLQRPRKAYSAKLCFLLDTTGSMHPVRDAVNDFIIDVVKYCERKYPMVELKVGFLGYKDVDVRQQDRYQAFDFTTDVDAFRDALAGVPCGGGGDEAEDVLGGMNEALKLSWEHQSTDVKVLVHIGDSPHHGRMFHDGPVNDCHEELVDQPRPYGSILADYADGHIDYTFAQVKNPMGQFTTSQMVRLFQESYDSNPARKSDFSASAVGEFSPKELFLKIKSSLTSSIQMFMASVASTSTSVRGAMPSKKPAAKSTLSAVPEERSMSSGSSGSSGTSKGMALALDKFASVSIDGGRSKSISVGGLGGSKRPVSKTASRPVAAGPALSSSSSTSVSFGGLGGGKKPVSSAPSPASGVPSMRSSSVSLGGLGTKRPAAA